MVWVKRPCVHDATLSGGWHVELRTPIVFGGAASVECISSVHRPAGTDDRVVLDKAFSTDRRYWSFVEVIRAMDLLLGRLLGSWHEKQRRLSVSSTWGRNSSHSCRGQFLLTVTSPAMSVS